MTPVNPELVSNIITVANTIELVKGALAEIGLEFLAPMDPSVEDEKISKAILARATGAAK